MKTIIFRSYECLNKEQIAAALKRRVCRHKNHEIKVVAGSMEHKIFCTNCNELLKIVHPEDSPAKITMYLRDYDDEFLAW